MLTKETLENCTWFSRYKRFDLHLFFKENHSHILKKGYFSQKRYQLLTFRFIVAWLTSALNTRHREHKKQTPKSVYLVLIFWRISFFLCVCGIYVCGHMYTCACRCVCRWVHICVEARDWCLWLLYPHCTLVFEALVSYWTWNHWLGWAGCPVSSRALPVSNLQALGL